VSAQALIIGSPNTVSAAPKVPRPTVPPCVVNLFEGVDFGDFSPKTFEYLPPGSCPGPWTKVVLEADWSIDAGVQYDRTANLWLGGANIYFGTTSEPSGRVARSWHVERDLTDYAPLFRSRQPGQADLGNLVNATYTSVLHGSARLLFYQAPSNAPNPALLPSTSRPADMVIPLSASATGGTVAITGSGSPLVRTMTFPRNVERAVLDVVAQSQANDEFWYTCVPNDVSRTLQSCGGTAFRETEISVDRHPAGIAPVYPWIYTGGIDPFLWAPIPGIQTLGFEPYRVEITPFAGMLDDGQPHTLSLSVLNAADNFATTANLLLWLDQGAKVVNGGLSQNTLAAPAPAVNENLHTAADGSVTGTVSVTSDRAFTIAGFIYGSHGRLDTQVTQQVSFSNVQTFNINAATYEQDIVQGTTISSDTSMSGSFVRFTDRRDESWPLSVSLSFTQAADGSATQTTTIQRGSRGSTGRPSATRSA
jgi:hypothetical protein